LSRTTLIISTSLITIVMALAVFGIKISMLALAGYVAMAGLVAGGVSNSATSTPARRQWFECLSLSVFIMAVAICIVRLSQF
jgi:ABC-type methionine transport system permease subunit